MPPGKRTTAPPAPPTENAFRRLLIRPPSVTGLVDRQLVRRVLAVHERQLHRLLARWRQHLERLVEQGAVALPG